ncbi:uncharacterized protein ACIB01_005626 [Guaruba guarouba]
MVPLLSRRGSRRVQADSARVHLRLCSSVKRCSVLGFSRLTREEGEGAASPSACFSLLPSQAESVKAKAAATPFRSASPVHTRRHTQLSLQFMPLDCLASARQTAISEMSTFATISTKKTTPSLLLLSAHQK